MFRRAVPDALVVYGTKAFPNVAVMRLLADEGLGADVASLGELAFARRAGIEGGRLIVHGNNKSDEELRAAADAGALVAIDALDEPARAAEAGVRRVLVRVTPGVETETHEAIRTGHRGSKFGLDAEDALVAIARGARSRARGRGIARARRLPARGRPRPPGGSLQPRRVRNALPRRARLDAGARRRRRRLRHPPRRGRGRAAGRGARALDRGRGRERMGDEGTPGAAPRLRARPLARRPRGVHALPRRRCQAGGRHALRRDRRRHVRQPAATALQRPLLRPARKPGGRRAGRRPLHDRRASTASRATS